MYVKNSRSNEVNSVVYNVDICVLAFESSSFHPVKHFLLSRLKIAFQLFECADDSSSASRMNTLVHSTRTAVHCPIQSLTACIL